MSSVEKISILGYKSIRALKDFPLRNLNLLIGANGAGKSNFIGFFRLLHEMQQQSLAEYVALKGGPDALLHFGRKTTAHMEGRLWLRHQARSYELERPWHTTGTKLHKILADFDGNPELINEHVTTAPSKRLMAALPGYQKTTHGPRAAKKIGLNKIETTCKHFRGWLNKLRTISSP